VRLALVVCSLMLLAPAAALGREPVVSYIDGSGVFRLYDEETETEVNPPPPVPTFAQLRYAMSQDGRYIVFNDAQKTLHLLDRATNTQVPLPGIDVYAADGPGSLTVSNTGLIGFDKNGNGPALVYNSATGQFVDTGLVANNGHRQTRLSGYGRFLGTTCLAGCIVDSGGDSDPYVQDLSSKSNTAFPDTSAFDEEHPCLDGDGSVFGIDTPVVTTRDIRLFDRSQSPPVPIALAGVNTVGDEVRCVLDEGGDYLGFFENTAAVFKLFRISSQSFVSLDRPFDERSQLSAPYTPPQSGGPGGGGPGGGQTGDRTKPVNSRFRLTHRRFRVRPRATSFKFVLSEPANARILFWRAGRRAGTLRMSSLAAGPNTISFSGRLGGRKLKAGEYDAVLVVTDSAGNLSLPVFLTLKVLRPAGDRRR
jgi:hypothetical protein